MQVENTDLSAIEKAMKQIGINWKRCKRLDAAFAFADSMVSGLTRTQSRFDAMQDVLEVPEQLH